MAAEIITPLSEPVVGTIHIGEEPVRRLYQAKRWVINNREQIVVVVAVIGSLWFNRVLMRKDLKRMNFTAEFYPDWMFDGEGEFVGIGG